jgi:hypothetical protein
VIDTSSLIAIKSIVSRKDRDGVFASLTALVNEARLFFPHEVMAELKRDSRDKRHPDPPCEWATRVEAEACKVAPTLEQVRAVLAVVRDILDPAKESGVDEADPYVLALAQKLRSDGLDARVVTEETKDSPKKLSLNTASGILGIPSVPLRGLLRTEGISVSA